MTDPYEWIGGQLTSQAVPPDEHPWIEHVGSTRSYREFRNRVRKHYENTRRLTHWAAKRAYLNPGQGWVSRLCHEPEIAHLVLQDMLARSVQSENLQIYRMCEPIAADVECDRVRSVTFRHVESGDPFTIAARFVLDASELGDLLPLTQTEYVVGSESQAETGERHATLTAEHDNVQGITWCFAMGFDPDGDHRIEKPATYEQWKSYAPDFWVGPLLSWNTLHAHTMQPHSWTLFGSDSASGMGLFDYRQIVSRKVLDDPALEEATIVNWPQNDYFLGSILDVPEEQAEKHLGAAKELSLSLLYWLQTEAPRPDGGQGWPGLRLRGDLTGTKDGFAQAPYIRESRRIKARFTVLEQHVSAHDNPGLSIAPPFPKSVGIGAYRIDLHPSTNGRNTVDFSSLPFQIPLGSLVPIRMRNLIPACKNIGVTHITNGCYRLHPVEWNIGEVAGLLAAFCIQNEKEPAAVYEDEALFAHFQALLHRHGIETAWPEFGPL